MKVNIRILLVKLHVKLVLQESIATNKHLQLSVDLVQQVTIVLQERLIPWDSDVLQVLIVQWVMLLLQLYALLVLIVKVQVQLQLQVLALQDTIVQQLVLLKEIHQVTCVLEDNTAH